LLISKQNPIRPQTASEIRDFSDTLLARSFFERALTLDPSNVGALVGMANCDVTTAAALMTDDRSARFAAAEAILTRVLSLAPEYALAHQMLGVLQIHTNRAAQGIDECERALALDRNLAAAHGFIGLAKIFIGHSEETEAHVLEALRLSPRDIIAHVWIAFAGIAKCYLGRDDEAVVQLRRAIGINTNFPVAHFCLAGALAHLRRLTEAQVAIQSGLALDPTFTIARFRESAPTDNPDFLAQHERVCDGMRKAGVPAR